MRTIAFVMVLLTGTNGLSQTSTKEADTQSLLVEVRQLRQAIEAMTVASQRTQIALYALQMQDGVVARATQRLDSSRDKCAEQDGNRRRVAAEIQKLESSLASGTLAEREAKEGQARLAEMKGLLEAQSAEVQTCQAAEAEASSQLRKEEVKLAEIQDRIDHLDKTLEKVNGPVNSGPR